MRVLALISGIRIIDAARSFVIFYRPFLFLFLFFMPFSSLVPNESSLRFYMLIGRNAVGFLGLQREESRPFESETPRNRVRNRVVLFLTNLVKVHRWLLTNKKTPILFFVKKKPSWMSTTFRFIRISRLLQRFAILFWLSCVCSYMLEFP